MKIAVSNCLGLECLSMSSLVAGKRGVDNRVRTVSVMDSLDVKQAVETNGVKDRLVLTSFVGLDDKPAKKAEIVEALADAGIAGMIVFNQKNGTRSLGEAVVNAAERKGLPLILMPYGSDNDYQVVIERVLDEIHSGDRFKNGLISNTIYNLLDFEKHNSFQAALKEAAVNNEFQIILMSRDFNPILVIETRQKAEIADVIRMGKTRNIEKTGIYTFVDVDGVLTYWGPMNINGEKYFVFIVDNEDNYSAGEMSKLAEIIELAAAMWKYTPERDVKAEFIRAVTRDNKSLAYSLKDEMVAFAPDAIVSVFYAKGIGNKEGEAIIDEFEKANGLEVMMLTEGAETDGIVVRKTGSSYDKTEQKLACIRMFETLKGIDSGIRIFHATELDGLEGACDACRLISETWTFVESVFPYKRVFTKYELALVSTCINIQVQGGHLKKVYSDLLEPFKREMGENKARQLLDTLETFVLDAGMNSSKTSEFMGIHTNTVQYRLKRINEVLGAEITGNRVIPGLTMALALKRLERVVV